MREDFLHHLWKYRIFKSPIHFTRAGQKVEIIHPGTHNHDSGPDFFNARIRIDDLEWAGNVEIHVKSSDWILHGHSSDSAYNNVILHVVYEDDDPESLRERKLPTLQVKGAVDPAVFDNHAALLNNEYFIPCAALIRYWNHDPVMVNSFTDRLFVEKFEHSTRKIIRMYKENQGDWDETFYQLLAQSFGFRINRFPFEVLARSLPLKIIREEAGELSSLEALLFGQAGFLVRAGGDAYTQFLKRKFEKMKRRYGLKEMDVQSWKFLRLRPGNFPTLRIAQFAALYHQESLSRIDIEEELLSGRHIPSYHVHASAYWERHSNFGKDIRPRSTRLGEISAKGLQINSFIPMLFAYGNFHGAHHLMERAMAMMAGLSTESNATLDHWKCLGIKPKNAFESQALLYLKKHYCDHKKCLSCAIGTKLLRLEPQKTQKVWNKSAMPRLTSN